MSVVWAGLGAIKYPLTFSLIAVVGLTLWAALKTFGPGSWADQRTKAWIDAVLFWGGFAMIAGVLGTLVGIILAAQSIEAVGEVSAPLLWGGIKVALLSSAVGFIILAFASLSWFGLQLRWRMMYADEHGSDA